jgi:hypothetical protein
MYVGELMCAVPLQYFERLSKRNLLMRGTSENSDCMSLTAFLPPAGEGKHMFPWPEPSC